MPATTAPPKHAYPRPPLVHDRATLFREPAYQDGEPYAEPDDEDAEPCKD